MRKILETTQAKRRFAAVILATLMLVNIFGAAAEKNPSVVTINCDGYKTTYETYAATVGDFLTNENIFVKGNDQLSHVLTDAIVPGMEIVYNIAKYVTVNDNGYTYGSVTYAPTVEAVLVDFQAPLKATDIVTPERGTRAYDGLVINIARSKTVTLNMEGEITTHTTTASTVSEFLNEIGVVLKEEQETSPSLVGNIIDGMRIDVFTVLKRVTDFAESSSSKRDGAGYTGANVTNSMSQLDFKADLSNARVIICEATAYTSAADECGKSDGITASGAMFAVGVVAVDPKVIPLGTKLYIESVDGQYVYGYCTALDTGGAIKGNKVDLAMNSKAECFKFGRRQVRVYILD